MKRSTSEKMKSICAFFKKNWITVWLTVTVAASAAFVTVASYTEVSSVKRVASTQSTPETLFSSNCMKYGGSRKQMSTGQYTVTVCNYDQNFPKVYNPAVVYYTFKAQLQLRVGDNYCSYDELDDADKGNLSGEALAAAQAKFTENAAKYGIQMTADDDERISDNTAYSFSQKASANYEVIYSNQSLAANVSSTDKFEVTIPGTDLNMITPEWFVYVEAKPVDSLLFTLYSRLYGATSEIVESTWKGELVENNTDTIDYDFYNYRLTGSSRGTIEVMWNPAWLEPNDFFFSSLAGNQFSGSSTPTTFSDDKHTDWKKVTLIVNNEKNQYELQFFKVKTQTSYTGDNDASNYIDYKFQASS